MVLVSQLPNFFILGAAKAGTTSLHYYLQQHPHIFLSKVKEPHFFDSDLSYAEGIHTYVSRHFAGSQAFPARGEATPAYFHRHEKVIPRMLKAFGESPPRFVLILRNPVERAWSHYLDRRRTCMEIETFERALVLEETRLRQNPDNWVSYYSDGLYSKQLAAWFQNFSRRRFLVILNEDLKTRPYELVTEICSFLEVNDRPIVDVSKRMNVASQPKSRWLMETLNRPFLLRKSMKYLLSRHARRRLLNYIREQNLRPHNGAAPKMIAETEALLRIQYADDLMRLQEMIGRDLTSWIYGKAEVGQRKDTYGKG